MAPKNKKKSGFYFFMKEMKDKEAARGCNIPMHSMPNVAHPLWTKLSLAEKEPYEEMARQFKNDPTLRGGKLAADGTRIEDNLREEQEQIRQENKMKQDVKQYCNNDCTTMEQFIDLAPKKLYYFISFNILCHLDDGRFIPLEVGLIEYSIQHGINREYSKILYPGRPPTGYAGKAKQFSDDVHRINIFGEDISEKDMKLVYEEIKQFINPVGCEYPPVFCGRTEIPVTTGCLDWLSCETGNENIFEVWDATYLLMELRAGVGSPLPSITTALDILSKTSFNYHPSTRCEFHEEKDLHYCALSYSKRLCYLLSDAVCQLFSVELTEKHIPCRVGEDKGYTVTVVKESSRTSNINPVRLDKTYNYYQNQRTEEIDRIEVPAVPRQPASTCVAEEMSRLNLEITTANLPGHGIGRGTRRN